MTKLLGHDIITAQELQAYIIKIENIEAKLEKLTGAEAGFKKFMQYHLIASISTTICLITIIGALLYSK